MARTQMWFGTRDYMTWVPAPAINMDASKVGWTTQSNYLNGGAYVRTSTNSHKEYNMSWNLAARSDIRIITDFADGIYGTGPIYWADPMAMDTNMLPQSWASPMLGAYDGPILSGKTTRPTTVVTDANSLGYPTQKAVYTIGAETKPTTWVPIPLGYTAWAGVHGTNGTGGRVVATPTTGPTTLGTPTNLTMLTVGNTTRFNYSVDSNGGTVTGLQISFGGTGTIMPVGIMVQVLPTGVTPAIGGFISGQGQSGARFASQPTLTEYSSVQDKAGLTAKLVEVGQWL